MQANFPWSTLNIEPTADVKEIRRAYALRLKEIDRDDIDGFQTLINARDSALQSVNASGNRAKPSMRELAGEGFEVSSEPRSASLSKLRTLETEPLDQRPHEGEKSSQYAQENTEVPDHLVASEFWQTLDAHLETQNWRPIYEMLTTPPAVNNRAMINEAERRIYDYLENNVRSGKVIIHKYGYQVLEGFYLWLGDPNTSAQRLQVKDIDPGILDRLYSVKKFMQDNSDFSTYVYENPNPNSKSSGAGLILFILAVFFLLAKTLTQFVR